MNATLLDFAHVNDAAAATTKKLQKQAILSEWFGKLEESDLRLAVRYTGGRAFSSTDPRVLNVGGAIVWDVVVLLLKLDSRAFHDLVVRSGEIGEALSSVWPDRPPPAPQQSITLHDLADAFGDLAATGAQERKRELLTALFDHCTHPREAAYLVKIIFGDLRTGVQDGVLQAAIAQAFSRNLEDVRRAHLLVGDLDEVAVLAALDALCAATLRLFHPIQFMLATPQETAESAAETMGGRSFFAEDKLDGIRAQVHRSADRIEIYSRTMDAVGESFPEIVQTVSRLPGEFLLDGEIVPWSDGCVAPFANLQKRLGRKTPTGKILRAFPVIYIPFDILVRDGQVLMDRPLRDRRSALAELLANRGPGAATLQLNAGAGEITGAAQITEAFESARGRRNEGIVLKDPDSAYAPGRRGQMWLKLKTHLPTLDCVVTAAEYGHGKRRNVLSDYTFAVWDRDPGEEGATLLNVGKAYSGVTDDEIARLTEIFLNLSRTNNGRVHLVEPKIVMEIACDQIQESKRHASGYAFRFPRIKRIRWDKRPMDADRLDRVGEIFRSHANFAHAGKDTKATAEEPGLFDEFT